MSPVTAAEKHRAQPSKSARLALLALSLAFCVAACAGNVPLPSYVKVSAEDYVPVPFTPGGPPIEIVPPRPAGTSPVGMVWADGGWDWGGERFRWLPGAWVVPPAGAKRAPWVIVRRKEDGQLFFAPSTWRDARGRPIDPPRALASASTQPGGPAGAGEITAPGGVRTDLDE